MYCLDCVLVSTCEYHGREESSGLHTRVGDPSNRQCTQARVLVQGFSEQSTTINKKSDNNIITGSSNNNNNNDDNQTNREVKQKKLFVKDIYYQLVKAKPS
jgi:hypothetical protein